MVGDGLPHRVHAVLFHAVWNQMRKRWLKALPSGGSCVRRGLIFLPQPLLKKVDGHVSHGAALLSRSGLSPRGRARQEFERLLSCCQLAVLPGEYQGDGEKSFLIPSMAALTWELRHTFCAQFR